MTIRTVSPAFDGEVEAADIVVAASSELVGAGAPDVTVTKLVLWGEPLALSTFSLSLLSLLSLLPLLLSLGAGVLALFVGVGAADDSVDALEVEEDETDELELVAEEVADEAEDVAL